MRDKAERVGRVPRGNKEVDEERPGGKIPLQSLFVRPTAVYKHVQRVLSFGGGSGAANDTPELEELD